jgi:hypothetical protein
MYLSRKLCLVMFSWDKCWVITPFHCYRSLHFRLLTRNTTATKEPTSRIRVVYVMNDDLSVVITSFKMQANNIINPGSLNTA